MKTTINFDLEKAIKACNTQLNISVPKLTDLTKHPRFIEKEDSDKSKRDSKRTNTIKTYTSISHLIENYEIATSEKLLFSTFDELKYWNLWNISDEILKDKIKIEKITSSGDGNIETAEVKL